MLLKKKALVDRRMHDGSRLFLELPASIHPEKLVEHLKLFPGVDVTAFLDSIPEAWIDFSFDGRGFSINNQFGEFWFFSIDAECADEILLMIRDYCVKILC